MKTLVLVVAGVLALAGLAFLLWGFWLLFIGLTLVYGAVAVGIIYVTALYYEAKAPDTEKHGVLKRFTEYLGDNNTWFCVLAGICAVTFVIACFNFGPALLLPENSPTPEQRGTLGNLANHLLYGKDAPKEIVPTEPLPWATGTWFWWKAFGLYVFLLIFYTPFAWWDEFSHACKGAKRFIKEEWEEHKEKQEQEKIKKPVLPAKAGDSAAAETTKSNSKFTFTEFLRWDLLVELAIEFAKLFFEKKRENKS